MSKIREEMSSVFRTRADCVIGALALGAVTLAIVLCVLDIAGVM